MKPAFVHPNSTWVIVTVKRPLVWARSETESWSFVPPIRYVINAEHIEKFGEHIDSVSDLKSATFYRPWVSGNPLDKQSMLIERHRNRGIGDILFMTGPMNWLMMQSGGGLKIYFKSLVDRGVILNNHPALCSQTPIYGTTTYDSFPLYTYHWMVETATELDEEPDQLNVYDCLYRQLGVDPARVSPEFKRPSVAFDAKDERALHVIYRIIHSTNQIDLRTNAYAVIAPMTHGFIRGSPYQCWLDMARELSKKMPVIVIGTVSSQTPTTDMDPGQAFKAFSEVGDRVVNLIGDLPLRTTLALIKHSRLLIGLDSAPIYMAQAAGTPAISLWGPHDPARRIRDDDRMMNLAIWKQPACSHAGCGAWRSFPETKCPRGAEQTVCQVLQAITVSDIMGKVDLVLRNP